MKEKNMISLSGYGWEAEVSPQYGMNTIRLSHEGKQILRYPENMDLLLSITTAGYGSPLLLPPNRTEHATFRFDGQTYYLPLNEQRYQNNIHGQLRHAQFRVEEETPLAVKASYRNIGEVFPFPFLVTVRYELDETGFHQSFTFENTGKTDMPLTFGLHTNFLAPEWFRVPLGMKWVKNSCHIPTGELIALSAEEESFRSNGRTRGKPITGFFTSAGTTAQLDDILYTVSDNFNQWQVWNGDGTRGFISIEPQCGAVNCLNSGAGLLRLKPGQEEVFTVWFHTA